MDVNYIILSMDFKEIKGTKHYLYDNEAEFRVSHTDIAIRHSWRHGEEGEWVYTDDEFVCQILRKSKLKSETGKNTPYVRTVCGTYISTRMNRNMLGENGVAENIYSMSGTNRSKKDYKKRGCNSRELIFARYVAGGVSPTEAYKLAFPDAKAENYIKKQTDSLLKTESVQKMVKQEIREILDEEGVTNNWLIERYKTIADMSESDTPKLRALDSLAKISGLFDTDETKSEQVTIWAGFSPEQLEEVKKHGKPELIAHAEKDKEKETS